MDAEVFQRIAAVVAEPGKRSERAQDATDLIRHATAQRWVGIYTATDTSVVNETWSGPGPPAFPTFPRERGLSRIGTHPSGRPRRASGRDARCR
jgi:putative methionine-R-sulfoxide reductase with GAF domain